MTAPATRAVVEALSADGADVRFVGGPVRDALLGRESSDIDIGTPDEPERVMALLERAGIETRSVPRGIAHGTVIAVAGGTRFEITTLRRDVETDGRHAEVAFTDDWREDAARRDFTINAMSMTPDGTLHDYFGGQADLEAGRVRFVGDPAQRIAEDHLRILRFFRFFAWYGQGEPDADALAACKDAAHTIPTLSGERVQAEMMKLLAADDPLPAVHEMRDTGVLAQVLQGAQGMAHLARLVEIERRVAESADPIRRLAALIVNADYGGTADVVTLSVLSSRWRLSAAQGAHLALLIKPPEDLSSTSDHATQGRLLHRLGREKFRDLVLLTWAGSGGSETAWREMLDAAKQWTAPKFPVTGADVLALGIPEGPVVGQLLASVENWWIEHNFMPDRKLALTKLDDLIAKRRGG